MLCVLFYFRMFCRIQNPLFFKVSLLVPIEVGWATRNAKLDTPKYQISSKIRSEVVDLKQKSMIPALNAVIKYKHSILGFKLLH